MDCTEAPLVFSCGGDTLVGVVASPRTHASDLAVLIVVGGPQYRTGSHRQFTRLARAIADAGWTCLRFDVRGMGDSSGQPAGFDGIDEDIRAAIDALQQHRGCQLRTVLLGLCDGASAALLYAGRQDDDRVAGLCLLNPWVRSAESLAAVHVRHYYIRRLASAEFWRKLLQGGIGRRAVNDLIDTLKAWSGRGAASERLPARGDFRTRMESAFCAFGRPCLVGLSGEDLTAREYAQRVRERTAWRRASASARVTAVAFDGADHTFSDARHERHLHQSIVAWMQGLASPALARAPSRPLP